MYFYLFVYRCLQYVQWCPIGTAKISMPHKILVFLLFELGGKTLNLVGSNSSW